MIAICTLINYNLNIVIKISAKLEISKYYRCVFLRWTKSVEKIPLSFCFKIVSGIVYLEIVIFCFKLSFK